VTIRTIVVAMVALALGAAPAGAVERRVAIIPAGFDPAVAVVAPGTEVVWRNDDTVPRRLEGDFARSPLLQPGQEFRHRFRRPGEYPYRDTDREAVEGTIIVALAGRGGRREWGPRPPGRVVHPYDATISVAVREHSKYRDGLWQSLTGPCNGEVGTTSRTVRWTVRLRDVEYTRLPPFESLTSARSPGRMTLFREVVDAKAGDSRTGPYADCGDGSTDFAPVHDVDCRRTLDGKAIRIALSWIPSENQGRFQFSNDGPEPRPRDPCGLSYLNTGVLVGIRENSLPLNLAGSSFLVDAGATSPATGAEVRAIRAGRAVTVVRGFHLRYTTDCCAGWVTEQIAGVYVRVGEVREVFAKLTIRLTPR
jgi:plastocyanin